MATMISTITSKGQTALPKAIRERFRLASGMKLEYEFKNNGIMVRPKRRELKIFALRGSLKHLDDGRPTEDIIEEAKRRAAYEIATGRRWTPKVDTHAHRRRA